MFLDFMYSKEGIDRKGIMTGITGSMEGHNAFDAGYFFNGNQVELPFPA